MARLNRNKVTRARRVIEEAERVLADKSKMSAGVLWRQDVAALRYVLDLALRAATEPWNKAMTPTARTIAEQAWKQAYRAWFAERSADDSMGALQAGDVAATAVIANALTAARAEGAREALEERDALQSRVQQLREALESIADTNDHKSGQTMIAIARAALTAPQADTGALPATPVPEGQTLEQARAEIAQLRTELAMRRGETPPTRSPDTIFDSTRVGLEG